MACEYGPTGGIAFLLRIGVISDIWRDEVRKVLDWTLMEGCLKRLRFLESRGRAVRSVDMLTLEPMYLDNLKPLKVGW